MPANFNHTMRALHIGRSRTGVRLILGAFILVIWFTWFFLAVVSVYEVSESGRLETTKRTHPVVSVVRGQVVKNNMVLGQDVKQGDVLIQLDGESQQLLISEEELRIAQIEKACESLSRTIELEKSALNAHQATCQSQIAQLRKKILAAEVTADLAKEKLQRGRTLRTGNAISEANVRQLEADAAAQQANLAGVRSRLISEAERHKMEAKDRQVRIAEFESDLSRLVGHKAIHETTLKRMQREFRLRIVRAPISGNIGQLREFPIGSAVAAGENLAVIVPPSDSHVVASFPVSASGRIRIGQLARLRLDGYSWTEYGSVPVQVARVANEPTSGHIRVELQLAEDFQFAVPMEHGLSGSVQVVVEHASPAELVLRSVGALLRTRQPTAVVN